MPITRATSTTYTLLNATVSEDGSLSTSFTVDVDGVTQFTMSLVVPEASVPTILDVTISDGKTIREKLTESICNYFIGTGQITGTLTA